MVRTYFVKSERLGFGVWESGDLALAQKLWSNSKTCHYISRKGYFSTEEIVERLNKEVANYQNYGIQYWPFFDLENGDLVGCCGFRPYMDGVYELGFHLLPEYWHKGLAYEAATTVISYLFLNTDIKKIAAGHHPQNTASAKVLTRLGFECTGFEFYAPTGLEHPTYSLCRDRWLMTLDKDK